jgi:hypothetical protein
MISQKIIKNTCRPLKGGDEKWYVGVAANHFSNTPTYHSSPPLLRMISQKIIKKHMPLKRGGEEWYVGVPANHFSNA